MVQVDKLHFDYTEKKDILKSISFTISDGEKVGIIGPNGAGKTTLFHILCGILKQSAGIIQINKKIIVYNAFNQDIGFVFQNPDDQLFNATVFDDVAFGPYNQALSRDEVRKRVLRALEMTNCLHLEKRMPHHLSGGEKRMVAIASVLSMSPKILIYDEPTSNLDMRARRILINFMKKSRETVLVASHDLEFILEVCSRVIVLDEGNIVKDGAVRQVMADETFMLAHGLERPHSLLHGSEHRHG